MRIRILGQHVPVSVAVLALVEAFLALLALYIAVFRFETPVATFGRAGNASSGPLWPRARLFTAIVLICLLAFGLYSARQRAQLSGVLVRVVAALADRHLRARGGVLPGAESATVARSRGARGRHHRLRRRDLAAGVCARGRSGDLQAPRAGLRRGHCRRADRQRCAAARIGAASSSSASCSRRRGAARRSSRAGARCAGRICAALCKRLNVDEVVVAMDDRRRGFPIRELLECRLAGVDVTELLTFLERETGRVRIDVLNPSWMIFGEGFRRDPLRLFSSRMLDLVASLLVLVICAARHAAHHARDQARGRLARAGVLRPGARRPGRAARSTC